MRKGKPRAHYHYQTKLYVCVCAVCARAPFFFNEVLSKCAILSFFRFCLRHLVAIWWVFLSIFSLLLVRRSIRVVLDRPQQVVENVGKRGLERALCNHDDVGVHLCTCMWVWGARVGVCVWGGAWYIGSHARVTIWRRWCAWVKPPQNHTPARSRPRAKRASMKRHKAPHGLCCSQS
jgi:hypothetical protein